MSSSSKTKKLINVSIISTKNILPTQYLSYNTMMELSNLSKVTLAIVISPNISCHLENSLLGVILMCYNFCKKEVA